VAGVLVLAAAVAFTATRVELLQGDPYRDPMATGDPAPELEGITAWFNAEPFTMASKRGGVVWLDVWTYSCINCIRSLPFVQAIHERYAASGLTVLGLHSPEFRFERDEDNVRAAVERFGLTYPVALDADMATWSALGNRFWPRVYLIGADGTVRFDRIGEGGHEELESQLRTLLAETGAELPPRLDVEVEGPSASITRELYAGYERGGPSNGDPVPGTPVDFTLEQGGVAADSFAFEGRWIVDAEFSEAAEEGARIVLEATARDVFVVAASATGDQIGVRVLVDGARAAEPGDDVQGDVMRIEAERLYRIVEGSAVAQQRVELIVGAGTRIYAFTFG
jgi:thiol-disulfide isomerase/thioredoxin